MTSLLLWRARQAVCYLDKSANLTTIDTDTSLDTFFNNSKTTLTAWIKDLSVTGTKGDVELLNLFGEDTNGFQNQILDQKPFDIAELSGTLVFSAVDSCKTPSSYLLGDPVAVDTTQLQACDLASEWVESANGHFDISDETTITKENSHSIKLVAQTTTGHNHYVTATISETDLSGYNYIGFWYKSNVTTTSAFVFGFGESAYSENTKTITPAVADQWVYCVYDISAITASSRNGVTLIGFKWNVATSGTIYIDDIRAFNNLRYQGGISNTTGGYTGRENVSILFRLTDGTNEVNVLLNNAIMVSYGDIKMASDGHAEVSISIKCLAKDYYEEY